MEKKKRFRPTLKAYRELEAQLASQLEGTSRLVADCDGWREKYEQLWRECCDLKRNLASESSLKEAACRRIDALESRGFWSRVFNR